MPKNLALFLDGTWNDAKDQTNVWWLHQALAPLDARGREQRGQYDKGVGTQWSDRLIGGLLGYGLSKNALEAYEWLADNYEENDDIYLFGFSRGAYTARSVAGLIKTCGLLRKNASATSDAMWDRYQSLKSTDPRHAAARPIHTIVFAHEQGKPLTPDEELLLRDSRRVWIKMIGVWDTVGALGIPDSNLPWIGRERHVFHNTYPSTIVDHSFHALAIDELRHPYAPTLWTKFSPYTPDPAPVGASEREKSGRPPAEIEQRWFSGSHSDVGGGYPKPRLSHIPLHWMKDKAQGCGLAFKSLPVLRGDEHRGEDGLAYEKFGLGLWKRVHPPFHRAIGAAPREVSGKNGTSTAINEHIDASVFLRFKETTGYEPSGVTDWAARQHLRVADLSGEQVVARPTVSTRVDTPQQPSARRVSSRG